MVSAVLFEVWANVEAFLRENLPGFGVVGLGTDENHTSKGGNWSGIVVELAIEVLLDR